MDWYSILIRILLSVSCFVASLALYRSLLHPLAKVPGPRTAGITQFWLAIKVSNGKVHRTQEHLHRKYGPVVRVAPNEVSLSSADALRSVYAAGSGFLKGPWYRVAKSPDTIGPGADSLDLLTEENMDRYRLQRRAIGPLYSIAGIEKHEHHIDRTISRFVTKVKSLNDQFIDLSYWMYIFAVDTLSNITFSEDQGYIEAGNSGNNFEESHKMWHFMSLTGIFPTIVMFLQNYALFAKRYNYLLTPLFTAFGIKSSRPMPMFAWAVGNLQRRLDPASNSEDTKGDALTSDLNSDLIQLHQNRPEFKTSYAQNMTLTNFGAGTDTISSSLTAILLCLGSSSSSQRRLHAELDHALASGSLHSPSTYQEASKLEYLQLCIKEAMRLYPALSMSMTRVHPTKSVTIDGYHLPAGTIVGINPYVIHQEKSIFGDDADVFVPERWIPSSKRSVEEIKNMERNMTTWGCPPRTCPGQSLAMIVMSKFLTEILAKFEVDVSVDDRTVSRAYFAIQMTGIKIRFNERRG
ncbi:cytochrome P450 [Viridothelium virens]|uniref:Cytochrome P450 n=1 Tax=Viridothelium virens TaxID=1048519 RepID=A0A6A6H9C6_VIRVR|nr:cytochrome P450 [Viridothelium virens]